jgi:DNA-binding NarL/FixJ family response regulator
MSHTPPAFEGVPAHKIIIIEDDLMYAKALQLRLERECNCRVLKIYTDGLSFINDLITVHADFIIMDHTLPDKNGSEILQLMNERGIQIPVIFITAYKFPEYLEVIGAKGALAYVAKSEIETICDIIFGNKHALQAHKTLNKAEHEFLMAVVSLNYNKEIANRFHISIDAVKKRKSKIALKLGISNNRQSFRAYAITKGWL